MTRAGYLQLKQIVICLFSVSLIVDAINGLSLRAWDLSISAFFKACLILLVILQVKRFGVINVIIATLLFYVIAHSFIIGDPAMAISSVEILLKFFSIVIFYLFFSMLAKQGGHDVIYGLAWIGWGIIAINVLLGMSGLGYEQYSADISGASIGSRGFFYAGNEVSVAYFLAVAIILMRLIIDKRFFLYVAVGCVFIVISALLATKLSILSVLVLFVSFPLLAVFEKKIAYLRLPKQYSHFAVLISVLFPLIALSSLYFLLYSVGLIERLSYFYNSVDLITFALSGRNIAASEALDFFNNSYSNLQMLFGSGYFWGGSGFDKRMVEIDIVDILMMYGLFGVVICYGFFLYILTRCVKSLGSNDYSKYAALTIILLTGVSLTAGHVLYSGLAAYLIAALFSLNNHRKHEEIS